MEIKLTAMSVINEDGFEEVRFTNEAISNLVLRDKGASEFFERGGRYEVAFTKIDEAKGEEGGDNAGEGNDTEKQDS